MGVKGKMKIGHVDVEKIKEKLREMELLRVKYIEERDDFKHAYTAGWIDALRWILKEAGEDEHLIILTDSILKKEAERE